MARWISLMLACTIAGAAYAGEDNIENDTAILFGPPEFRAQCRLELHDVHGLWGGTAVFVDGGGVCGVQKVDPSRAEIRSRFVLDRAEVDALFRRCSESDLAGLRIPDRQGVPDETQPILVLRGPEGRSRSVAKWGNDRIPAFDGVYQAMLALAERDTPATSRGKPHEADWRPWPHVVVVVGVFSGRPDPTFVVDQPGDLEAIAKRLDGLEPGDAPAAGGLGYHGVSLRARDVPGIADDVRVFRGALGVRDGNGRIVNRKDGKGLEDWALAEAGKRGIVVQGR